jgi:hypothetical protein
MPVRAAQGTAVEGTVARLLEGKYKMYIRCINVDYESSRLETFYGMPAHTERERGSLLVGARPTARERERDAGRRVHGPSVRECGPGVSDRISWYTLLTHDHHPRVSVWRWPCSDIQLNVKGLKTLEDSFRDCVQVETMDGDNKYMAEGHGLQVRPSPHREREREREATSIHSTHRRRQRECTCMRVLAMVSAFVWRGRRLTTRNGCGT